jgi:hypothetical protein
MAEPSTTALTAVNDNNAAILRCLRERVNMIPSSWSFCLL